MEGCARASNRSSQDGERRGGAMEKEKGGKKWKMEDGDNYETHLRAVRSPEENGGCREGGSSVSPQRQWFSFQVVRCL